MTDHSKDALDTVAFVAANVAALVHVETVGTTPDRLASAVSDARSAVAKLVAVVDAVAGVNHE